MKTIFAVGAITALLMVGVMSAFGTASYTVFDTSNMTVFETLQKHPLGDYVIPENLSHLNLVGPGPDGKFEMKPVHVFDASAAPGDINVDWQPSI
jgi:hypothetical protein